MSRGSNAWRAERRRLSKELASTPPPYPEKLVIYKDRLGCVSITRHAWERFVKRYSAIMDLRTPGWYIPEHFVKKMQDALRRAREQRLNQVEVVKRLIDHDFTPVRYFLDGALQLRFVIKKEEPILLTVEIAYR